MTRPIDYAYCSVCERRFELNLDTSNFADSLCPSCREKHPAVIAENGFSKLDHDAKERYRDRHSEYMESHTPTPVERFRECSCGTRIDSSEWECWKCKREREREQEEREAENRRIQEERYRDSH